MKRHPALQELSREHHLLLLQARQIRWYVEGDRRAPLYRVVWREFWEAWETTAIPHLQTEERVLLPFLTHLPSWVQQCGERIREEHERLRGKVSALQQAVGDEARRALMAEVGQGLHDHIRFEERVFFQKMQRVLSERDFGELDARFREFRAADDRSVGGQNGS